MSNPASQTDISGVTERSERKRRRALARLARVEAKKAPVHRLGPDVGAPTGAPASSHAVLPNEPAAMVKRRSRSSSGLDCRHGPTTGLGLPDIHDVTLRMPRKVYVLGSGPNGRRHYSEIPFNAYVIAVNRAAGIHLDVPSVRFKPAVWVVADHKVTEEPYFERINRAFSGIRVFSVKAARMAGLADSRRIADCYTFELASGGVSHRGFRPTARKFRINGTVACCAMWLAYLCGAEEVVLCGIDMGGDEDYLGSLQKDGRHGKVWKARDGVDKQIIWHKAHGMSVWSISETKLRDADKDSLEPKAEQTAHPDRAEVRLKGREKGNATRKVKPESTPDWIQEPSVPDIHDVKLPMPRRVYILGSGPNGKPHYGEIPEDAYVIAVNRGAAIHLDFPGVRFKPSVWVVADPRAVRQKYWPRIDREFDGTRVFSSHVLGRINLCTCGWPACTYKFDLAPLRDDSCGFWPPPPREFARGGTVAAQALWLSYLCGAKEIVLCGIDQGGDADYLGPLRRDKYHGEVWATREGLDRRIEWLTNHGIAICSISDTKLTRARLRRTPELRGMTCISDRSAQAQSERMRRRLLARDAVIAAKVRRTSASNIEHSGGLPSRKASRLTRRQTVQPAVAHVSSSHADHQVAQSLPQSSAGEDPESTLSAFPIRSGHQDLAFGRWNNTFIGQYQQHNYWLYKIVDDILLENPHIERVVELGTGHGALSIVLALHACKMSSAAVGLLTVDTVNKIPASISAIFQRLSVNFLQGDCFDPSNVQKIMEHMNGRPTFFFCDGGNKVREFNLFAGRLGKGSIIAAHDYTTEITLEDIAGTVSELGLQPIKQHAWNSEEEMFIRTCFFKVPGKDIKSRGQRRTDSRARSSRENGSLSARTWQRVDRLGDRPRTKRVDQDKEKSNELNVASTSESKAEACAKDDPELGRKAVMDPVISVIMPTYKREHSIHDTVRSILEQTFQSWQLIIIDNYGSDYTFDDPRIEMHVHKEKASASYARNLGLKYARGKIICFFDDDDLMEACHLQTVVNAFVENPRTKMVKVCMSYPSGRISSSFATPLVAVRRGYATPTWDNRDRSHDQRYFRNIARQNGWTEENSQILSLREVTVRVRSSDVGGLRDGGF
jgi:hypothetical protein